MFNEHHKSLKALIFFPLFVLCLQVSTLSASNQNKLVYPQTSFVVLSDPHFFDPTLGTSGAAFLDYLDKDRKLLAESEELLDAAIKAIEPIHAEFVIISGDLTKDGEKHNHQKLA